MELVRDARAPPLRNDVEPFQPIGPDEDDSDRLLGSLGDPNGSGRILERLNPALVNGRARKRKTLRRKDVREGRNRGVLLELGK